jgi:hypothetical protein
MIFEFSSLAVAQTRVEETHPPLAGVQCTIHIPSASWRREEPALVELEISNLTEKPLDADAIPVAYLDLPRRMESLAEHDYWSPVDVQHDQSLGINRRPIAGVAEAIRPIPLRFRLQAKESQTFVFDLARSHWAKETSSIWPDTPLFHAIEPGDYVLRLEFEAKSRLARCNSVPIKIEK